MREQGAERLLNLMTQLPDDLLDEAISYQKPTPKVIYWNKGALVAACLCVCLIGGLAWDTLRESVGETGSTGAGVTAGGVTAGGAAGGHEDNPTLAPTEQTGARPIDSTDERPVDSTETTLETSAGTVGMMVSEFRYKGQLYRDTGVWLEELPESCLLLGTLSGEDWATKDQTLTGSKVYRMEGDHTGLYVETEDGYRYYGKGSAGE